MHMLRRAGAAAVALSILSAAAGDRLGALQDEATSFGRIHVGCRNRLTAIREGEAARRSASDVLGLSIVDFTIIEASRTEAAWGDLDSDGRLLYPWTFKNMSAAEDRRPPDYVLRHEIGHDLFVRYLVPSSRDDQYGGDAPDWLDEMAAVAFEGAAQQAIRRSDAGRYAREGTLVPLSRFLAVGHPELMTRSVPRSAAQPFRALPATSNETPQFYAMTRALYDFLVAKTRTFTIVAELAAAFRAGKPLNQWLLARTGHGGSGDSLATLDAELLAWIASDERYAEHVQHEVAQDTSDPVMSPSCQSQ